MRITAVGLLALLLLVTELVLPAPAAPPRTRAVDYAGIWVDDDCSAGFTVE